jgi:hypothetical protein
MRTIEIRLNNELFAELERAAHNAREPGFGAAEFATEAVESVLASRRLSRVTPGKIGARIPAKEPGLQTHRVLLPAASDTDEDRLAVESLYA